MAPSAVPSPRFKSEPRALTARELRGLVDGYATAARHCREGGIDGIEISMAHGYLIAQFFTERSNRRDDAYAAAGGRLRFAEEVLEAVREAAGPELAVGVRLAADELTPDGLDAAACAEIAGALCATGLADFASFALGHSAYVGASSWIAPPPPTPEAAIAEPLRVVRDAVDVPVIGTTRVVDVAAAERLVADGLADAVGMTRALIADPALVRKAAHGATREVIACIGCNQGCIGHYHAGLPIACVVNPWTGRERTLPRRSGPARALRVLVIGAGPAGVAAALSADEHGDAVVLAERGADVGGQLRIAGRAPAHRELWRRWHTNATRALERSGVELRLGTEIAAEDADADVVVLATGARPYAPEWAVDVDDDRPFVRDRAGHHAVLDAWTAIANPAAVDGPVLVADWGGGWEGLDAAETLAEQGREVTLACAAPCPGDTLHQYQRNLYLARLDERGIAIEHHTRGHRPRPAPPVQRPRAPAAARRDARRRPRPRAGGRVVGRARGPRRCRPRRRRARAADRGGGDARGRHRAPGRARRGRLAGRRAEDARLRRREVAQRERRRRRRAARARARGRRSGRARAASSPSRRRASAAAPPARRPTRARWRCGRARARRRPRARAPRRGRRARRRGAGARTRATPGIRRSARGGGRRGRPARGPRRSAGRDSQPST